MSDHRRSVHPGSRRLHSLRRRSPKRVRSHAAPDEAACRCDGLLSYSVPHTVDWPGTCTLVVTDPIASLRLSQQDCHDERTFPAQNCVVAAMTRECQGSRRGPTMHAVERARRVVDNNDVHLAVDLGHSHAGTETALGWGLRSTKLLPVTERPSGHPSPTVDGSTRWASTRSAHRSLGTAWWYRSTLLSTWSALRMPIATLETARWSSAKAIAAAGSVVPCRSQTPASSRARAIRSGGAWL